MDKIVCVGKNYAEHAKELGDAVPQTPVLFLKPPSVLKAATSNGARLGLVFPQGAGAVHHECEIVLKLKQGGYRMSEAAAKDAIGWVSVGLDMTLRDRQAQSKKAGHPWTTSKVFPDSAVVGPWVSIQEFTDFSNVEFQFSLEGRLRQKGKASQMSFSPAKCVALASEYFPLVEGDLIYTGTPAGVGPVESGQQGELSWGSLRYQVVWE